LADMVVADAGPLIAFGHLDGFDLFPDVLGQVLVPEQVIQECIQKPDRPDTIRIQMAVEKGWLTVESCDSHSLVSLPPSLGEGEAAAITLALKQHCPVLMDDKLARQAAKLVGLSVVGTVGVLLKAKQIGRLKQIASVLELLRSKDYYLSHLLVEKALLLAGEQ